MNYDDCYDYEDMFQYSEMEELKKEYADKMLSFLTDEAKANYYSVITENDKMKNKVKDMQDKIDKFYTIVHDKDKRIRELEEQSRKTRLRELMKDREIILYSPSYKNVYGVKCDKCDEDRKLKFTTPRGKESFEMCRCSDTKIKEYYTSELVAYNMELRDNGRSLYIWYTEKKSSNEDDCYYSNGRLVKDISDSLPFESLYEVFKSKEYNSEVYFSSKELCDKFIEYINAK